MAKLCHFALKQGFRKQRLLALHSEGKDECMGLKEGLCQGHTCPISSFWQGREWAATQAQRTRSGRRLRCLQVRCHNDYFPGPWPPKLNANSYVVQGGNQMPLETHFKRPECEAGELSREEKGGSSGFHSLLSGLLLVIVVF